MKVADQVEQQVTDPTKRQHLVPDDGYTHVHQADCWCVPEPMEDFPLIYIHNPGKQLGSALLQ